MKIRPPIGDKLACSQAYYEKFILESDKLLGANANLSEIFPDILDEEEIDSDPFGVIERGRLEFQGSVAVLKIEGFLSNRASFLESFFDFGTSYESTNWALDHILENEEITSMLMVIDSGGGEVSGLSTVTNNIRLTSQSLKKSSFSFTDSVAASAAYAMLISNTVSLADPWATVGSVGVVQTFSTQSRMLEEDGIDIFVARSGDRKMKPSGVEPMDEETKEILTAEVMGLANLFFDLVANLRGNITSEDWKSGKTYLASEARGINMIDGVITLSTLEERLLNS